MHAIRYLCTGILLRPYPFQPLPKPRVCLHRPTDAGAIYRWVRMDGAPVMDEDLEEVARCDICYPVKKEVFEDNRATV